MAGTVTVTRSPLVSLQNKRVEKIKIDWVGDGTTGAVPATVIQGLKGFCIKALTKPTVTPTAYTVQMLDPDMPTIDALINLLAGRSTSVAEQVFPAPALGQLPAHFFGDYTFNITGQTNASASGTVILYIADEV